MPGLLTDFYLWTTSFHVIAVVAWMAGLFYLPRLFVYHAEKADRESALDQLFQVMERRLLKGIMNPAMIATWVFGLMLVMTPGVVDWSMVWPWTKAASVILMTWFHMWLGMRRKDFAAGQNSVSGRHFRLMNEVPTILLIIIVTSVIVKF